MTWDMRERAPELALGIGDLLNDHEALTQVTRRLAGTVRAAASGRGPETAAAAMMREFIDHYRRHLEREEAELFPAARQSLNAEDWAAIEAAAAQAPDTLLGPEVEADLHSVYDGILSEAWQRADGRRYTAREWRAVPRFK